MEMVESYGDDNGKEDRSILVYVGMDNPVKIMGKSGYSPDHFAFEYNKKTKYYEPSIVLSIHKDGSESEGVFDKNILLNEKDLTPEFLLQYYKEDEEEFLNFFDEAKTRGLSTQQKLTTQIHLVIVANTEEIFIGNSCVIDKKSTLQLFTQVARKLEIPIKSTIIDGLNFNKKNVVKALENIKPNPNDIVIFYYSGHGFNIPRSSKIYPYLDLRENSSQDIFKDNTINSEHIINIETIYDGIVKKGARLNLVISDCCNSDPGNSLNILPEGAVTRASAIGWNSYNCQALFMNPQPFSLLITAASKGELSAGTPVKGGIFTFNFRESLESNLSPLAINVNWGELVSTAKAQTISTAKRTGCRQPDKSLAACKQSPVFRMSK